jgi:hypothetical protein
MDANTVAMPFWPTLRFYMRAPQIHGRRDAALADAFTGQAFLGRHWAINPYLIAGIAVASVDRTLGSQISSHRSHPGGTQSWVDFPLLIQTNLLSLNDWRRVCTNDRSKRVMGCDADCAVTGDARIAMPSVIRIAIRFAFVDLVRRPPPYRFTVKFFLPMQSLKCRS